MLHHYLSHAYLISLSLSLLLSPHLSRSHHLSVTLSLSLLVSTWLVSNRAADHFQPIRYNTRGKIHYYCLSLSLCLSWFAVSLMNVASLCSPCVRERYCASPVCVCLDHLTVHCSCTTVSFVIFLNRSLFLFVLRQLWLTNLNPLSLSLSPSCTFFAFLLLLLSHSHN